MNTAHNIPIEYVGIPSYERYIREHGYSLSEMISGILSCFTLNNEAGRLDRIQSADSCMNSYLDYIETASYVKLFPNSAGTELKNPGIRQKKKKLDHDFFYNGLREFCVQEILDAYVAEVASINALRPSSRKIKAAVIEAVRNGKTRGFYSLAVKNVEDKYSQPKISFMDKFYNKPLRIIIGSEFNKNTNVENLVILDGLDEKIIRYSFSTI